MACCPDCLFYACSYFVLRMRRVNSSSPVLPVQLASGGAQGVVLFRTVSTIAALCAVGFCAAPSTLATEVHDDTAEKVAYCLGQTEAEKQIRDFIFSLPNTPPKGSGGATQDQETRATINLLRTYLANRHFTTQQNTPMEVVHAYARGAAEAQSCFRDQTAPGSCNAECAKHPDTSGCSQKCPLPDSCKRPDPCPDLERTLTP
jgi:hypothetical protein